MLELKAQIRENLGRTGSGRDRKNGLIPAVLYGHNLKNLHLSVNYPEFEKTYKSVGETTMLKLKLSGLDKKDKDNERVVLIYKTQKDPVSDRFIHIDFYQPKLDEMITARIPLAFVGESAAVSQEGGVLLKNMNHIEVEALPLDLPKEIQIDISILKSFEEQIRVKDIKISDKVKIKAGLEEMVARVLPPRSESELEELEKAPEEKVDEVEVITKEKEEKIVEEEPLQKEDSSVKNKENEQKKN